jgi:hypothetical protein
MVRSGIALLLGAAIAAGLTGGSAVAGQIIGADISTDTIGFGDRFELLVRVRVPAGSMAWVPESFVETDAVAGVGTVEWTVESAPDGASDVSLRYGIVPYQVGIVNLPEMALFLGPRAGSEDGEGEPGAGRGAGAPVSGRGTAERVGGGQAGAGPVAVFSLEGREVRRDGGEIARDGADVGPPTDLEPLVIPRRSIWVTSILRPQDVEQGLEPRPADDVVGPSWNMAAMLSAFLFASILLAVTFVSGRDWWSARARVGVGSGHRGDPIAVARAKALAELDALIAAGCSPDAAAVEAVYEASSAAVRRYVEHLERTWSPSYTSTELMRGLEGRAAGGVGSAASGGERAATGPSAGSPITNPDSIEPLVRQMAVAEVVKFGRLRPGQDDALGHCRTLRRWVAAS